MFPWLLCFLSASYENLTGRTVADANPESRVWWDPTETARDLDGFEIQEGDILVPLTGDGSLKNAISSGKYLWENGIVPYEFNDNFSCTEKDQVLEAMKVLEEKTCVKFVEKNDQKTFIRFQKENNGCYAPIGRLSGNEGPLPVNLQSPECISQRGIIEHELLHVLGLFHEQARPDRDDFVTVHWCNIQPSKEKDFRKASPRQVTTFGLPYDFSSIMHYPKLAFSRNGKPTITAKENPNMTLGQRERPSENDFEKVLKMYGCESDGGQKWDALLPLAEMFLLGKTAVDEPEGDSSEELSRSSSPRAAVGESDRKV